MKIIYETKDGQKFDHEKDAIEHEEKLLNSQTESERKLSDLENQFLETYKQISEKINSHIERASDELDIAIAISEEHGIPFTSALSSLKDRAYLPKSFTKKWPGVDCYEIAKIVDDDDMMSIGWARFESGSGWEYWNTSSLTC